MGSSEYDFIVVGAGPAGSALASRLAHTSSAPKVLLLEAGSRNEGAEYLAPSDRFTLAFKEASLNWGYKTAPQTHLKGQEIDYSRGRGLGGSTAINFSCWVVGPGEDYDEWAGIVGDESFAWKEMRGRLKRVENYHVDVPEAHKRFLDAKPEDHGTDGPIHLSYADSFEKGLEDIFIAAEEVGLGTNKDVNSGNPIGMGMGASCMYQGARTTAAAYLKNAPENLTIVTDSPGAKILLEGKKAVGFKTIDGKEYRARKEVLLSAGALNSPQLLMLSGIGPAAELKKHNIELVHELTEVGQNLQDHCFSTATLLQKSGTNDRMTWETSTEEIAEKKAKAAKDLGLYTGVPMGWFKNDAVLASREFEELGERVKSHIRKPTVPTFEIATHTPPLFTGDYVLQSSDSYLTALAFVMNPQSNGEVVLRSSNPSDAPIIDPKLLSHPFDKRSMIESMRALMDYLEAPAFKRTTVKMIGCPRSRSDEDIWDHCSGNLFSSWHMCTTVRMGSKDDAGACVDTDFRVRGMESLRVVDMSVAPFVPNNHVQTTAYLMGELAAEKMIREYGLGGSS